MRDAGFPWAGAVLLTILACSVDAAVAAGKGTTDERLDRVAAELMGLAEAEPSDCPQRALVIPNQVVLCGEVVDRSKREWNSLRAALSQRMEREGATPLTGDGRAWSRRDDFWFANWSLGATVATVILTPSESRMVFHYPVPCRFRQPADPGDLPGFRIVRFDPPIDDDEETIVTLPCRIESTAVRPEFPVRARQERLQGNVTLQGRIDKGGVLQDLEVLRIDRAGLGFEEAALKAVRKWRYEPATANGEPVAVLVTIAVDFALY